MGDGDTPDPPIAGGDDDDGEESDDDTTPATLDEFSSENEDTNGGSGAGAAATAAGAGAAAGAAGAGAGAGAGGTGGASGTSGTDDATGDEPGTDTPDDPDAGPTAEPEPAQPEEPDSDTEPGSEDDAPHDDGPGQDHEGDHREDSPDDQDVEDPDEDADRDDEDEADDSEDEEDEDEDDDEDDEEEETAVITQYSDAWDNVGFGLYPVYYQLKAEYGDEIDLQYRLVPVREFDAPEEVVDRWDEMASKHGMPTETSVWQEDPPTSTTLSNRALAAARPQGQAVVAKYLRRLRIAAIVEGRNIEDKETLFEIAAEVGLDTDQLEAAWDDVEVRTSRRSVTTPTTLIEVDGETIELNGLPHVNDIKMMLDRAGLEADPLPHVDEFVAEYGPVALQEIVQVCGFGTIDEAKQAVQESDRIEPVQLGDTTFWNSG